LKELRKDFEIRIYPGVGHAFANPSGTTNNAAAAEDAWNLTTDFLKRHLATAD
jgi:carboxymethylenebutenolidase